MLRCLHWQNQLLTKLKWVGKEGDGTIVKRGTDTKRVWRARTKERGDATELDRERDMERGEE